MESVIVSIIVALITGGCSIIGVVIATNNSNKVIEQKLVTAQAVTDTKLDNLTLEVRKHNNFAERIPVIEEQQKELWRRINKLEDK